MFIINKKVGETPLEALENFRKENPKFKNDKISYIGRLDPVASGEMILLIGDSENKNREKFLGLNKIYEADFLFGFSTDTGDILGLILKHDFTLNYSKQEVEKIFKEMSEIKAQKYPWFSSKHVNGRALFDWYKNGDFHKIKRPSKKIYIEKISRPKIKQIKISLLAKKIKEKINKVKAENFRQKIILEKWQEVFDLAKKQKIQDVLVVKVVMRVSTGTYIRGLNEHIMEKYNIPSVLLNLKRQKIILENVEF